MSGFFQFSEERLVYIFHTGKITFFGKRISLFAIHLNCIEQTIHNRTDYFLTVVVEMTNHLTSLRFLLSGDCLKRKDDEYWN